MRTQCLHQHHRDDQPAADPGRCCFAFGIGVKNTKQGKAIFAAMFILLVIFTGIIAVNEHAGTPQLADGGAVNIEMTDGQAGGNMEGKESRFGIASSSTWSAFTTAASNGSVNSMHDSYTPLGGLSRCSRWLWARSSSAAWAAACTA